MLLAMGCKEKKPAIVETNPRVEKPAPVSFVPPSDGVITVAMAGNYARARAEMVQVNAHLLDSAGLATPDRKAVFARALELACEKVSRRNSLRGAAEYRWIQENAAALPQNREAMAQAGIIIP